MSPADHETKCATLRIRPATEHDARAISTLIRQSADIVLSTHYSQQQLTAWKRNNTPARVRQRMLERTTFCAHRAGRLCATIALQGTELVSFYVRPGSRGKGIGSALLSHLETFAMANGIAALHLTSTPAALDFYLRCGWRAERAVVVSVMGVDFEDTFMTKRLDEGVELTRPERGTTRQ
jgi:GNAT superfamily N-acetyltransferase